ncbi:MAG TPA: dihydroxyacetone kinase family protein [Microlunatus sp.]|nr:dihydroxyacetone kinase family protein [Microlunatus sp.]
MTRLYDDPARFAEDLLEGFLDAHGERVVGVPGGVVRAVETPAGKVAVVVGGGSGHYPAFCGVVGPGFADGAVVGNIFTSPSTQDAYMVGKAAASDGGLLFSTGNYAGDVMNFTLAQQRLIADGVDTRVVFVTDDIASAPSDEIERRRGIAGDFVVFKIAGAAADEGYVLDEVERVARHANARTRTLGVAFAGCTMPGADHPLFEVPAGQMGVGLGIHGEPGVSEAPLPSAADLATRLVEGVLAEAPRENAHRVGVILNGLGTTKYEELFVVWRTVARLLRAAGYTVVDPEVGELVTSLDMSGCSLTVVHLDDELERLWRAPADTPAYRKGSPAPAPTSGPRRAAGEAPEPVQPAAVATDGSRRAAQVIVAALQAMQVVIVEAEDELGRIDAVAGDGDHGRGMVKGIGAATAAAARSAEQGHGAAGVLGAAGEAWAAKAGGTSGVLWGAALHAVGDRLGDQADRIAASDVADAVAAGLVALQTLGKAALGDKTMLDVLIPFVEALQQQISAGAGLAAAWTAAAEIGDEAARATADLRPRIGRARPLAERSVGTPDAGAVSLALCLRAVGQVLTDR